MQMVVFLRYNVDKAKGMATDSGFSQKNSFEKSPLGKIIGNWLGGKTTTIYSNDATEGIVFTSLKDFFPEGIKRAISYL